MLKFTKTENVIPTNVMLFSEAENGTVFQFYEGSSGKLIDFNPRRCVWIVTSEGGYTSLETGAHFSCKEKISDRKIAVFKPIKEIMLQPYTG